MAIKLIKDPILGNIEFSRFEEYFFYNPLLNRLHNVIQNSMAYRVYPSVKTSRFAHSIGVMHLASKIFQCGVSNSDEEVLSKYLKEKSLFLSTYTLKDQDGNVHYPDLIEAQLQKKLKGVNAFNFLHKHAEDFFGNEYISHVSATKFNFFQDKNNFVVFLILQQSIRLYALTHDLGHLPYSHITEFAIEGLEYSLFNKGQKNPLTPNEDHIYNIIKKLTDGNDKIHEVIGKKIFGFIIEDIYSKISTDNNLQGDKRLAYSLFVHLIDVTVKEIKKKELSALSSLLGIVAGDLEADRIDFVMRDGLYSGLVNKTGDTERVIKMFCLVEDKAGKGEDKYRFMPAIQSLNDVQEIIIDRFRIYKYLVNHHKVKKLDYSVLYAFQLMLQEEIASLNKDDDLTPIAEIGSKNLIDLLKICRDVFRLNDGNYRLAIMLFLQLTDNWLLSILNEKYLNLLTASSQLDKKQITLRLLLDEIFTGQKNFISLWKRDQEYYDFLRKISRKLLTDEMVDHASKIISSVDEKRGRSELSIYLEKSRLAEDRISSLITAISKFQKNWNQHLQEWFQDKGQLILCCIPKLNLGITDLKLVDLKNKETTILFRDQSKSISLINSEINSSTQFFIYKSKDCILSDEQISIEIVNFIKHIFLNNIFLKIKTGANNA